MKSTELRIGNWIKVKDNLLKVTSISEHMICCDNWGFDNFDDIEGIELTSEILLKNKFFNPKDKNIEFVLVHRENCDLNISIIIGGGRFITSIVSPFGMVMIPDCHFVHTLQNLFYSLTNTELTIEL